jgi:hypothetical protein
MRLEATGGATCEALDEARAPGGSRATPDPHGSRRHDEPQRDHDLVEGHLARRCAPGHTETLVEVLAAGRADELKQFVPAKPEASDVCLAAGSRGCPAAVRVASNSAGGTSCGAAGVACRVTSRTASRSASSLKYAGQVFGRACDLGSAPIGPE